MIQKLINKKKKNGDIFHIPQKKFNTQSKVISKLSQKNLIQLVTDQEKYISILIQKLTSAKEQFEKVAQKIDEVSEKNDVVNAQISRMSNQHEELSIKFDNLQASLEYMTSSSESMYRKEVQFLKEQQIPLEKIKNMESIMTFYRSKFQLCKKIEIQNKNLKEKYSQLELGFQEISSQLKQSEKEKGYNSLIPNLMQELQQLKKDQQEKQQKTGKAKDEETMVKNIEQQIMSKVKNQIQTASTQRSEETKEVRMQKIHELEEKIKDLSRQIQRKTHQNGKLSNEKQFLQKQNQKVKKEIVIRKNQIEELNVELSAKVKSNQRFQNSIKELKNKIQGQNNINIKLKQEIKKIINEKQQISDKLSEKEQQLLTEKKSSIELKQQLSRESSKTKETQKLLQTKIDNQEFDKILKSKNKIQAQCYSKSSQIKKNIEKIKQQEQIIKDLSVEKENIKSCFKIMTQEKEIMQQTTNECLNSANLKTELMASQNQELKKQLNKFKELLQKNHQQNNKILNQKQNLEAQVEKIFKLNQKNESEAKKMVSESNSKEQSINQLKKANQQQSEDSKIKFRKYECDLNQQRIKNQSMNRKVNILEVQAEQNKEKLDKMYEQSLSKDQKQKMMDIKLKQYKSMIQVLKKEKEQLQKCYEIKLKKMQNCINQESEEESKSKCSSRSKEDSEKIQITDEQTKYKNEVISLQEGVLVLKEQNQSLRQKIIQFEEVVNEKSCIIKSLKEKRDQLLKEFSKMNSKEQICGSPTEIKTNYNINPPPAKDLKQNKERQKKIASKAFKGFDILTKLNHSLYKDFIKVFTKDLAKEEVKNIEGEINVLVKKSNDMKDIFEDYL